MRRIIISIVIIAVLCCGVYFFLFSKEEKVAKEKKVQDVEVSMDLFGDYYDKASKVVQKMSIEEKIGQLFLVRYDRNMVESQLQTYYPGGYILFAKDFEGHDKTSILKELTAHQEMSKYPLIFGVDEEGGIVTRVSRYSSFRSERFQSPQEIYQNGGFELLEATEREKAELLTSIGIYLNLAPVADVSVSSDDYIYSRSFGKDAKETSLYIEKMVEVAREMGISSCLKHFPGYGNNVDTHTGSAYDTRSYDTFLESDYLPFIAGIEKEVPTILVSHNVMECVDPVYPASLSFKVVTGELREKLGFSGIIITDDLAMDAISAYVQDGTAAVMAVNAGNDMIITSDLETMYQEVLTAYQEKKIESKTIDQAVKRIIAWKYAYGLF